MYCEECKSRPAAVTITEMFNGKQVQLHLCPECAAQKGMGFFNLGGASLPKLLGSFFGFGPIHVGQVQPPVIATKSCPNCHISPKAIGQHGRLGCSQCYEVFREQLEPTLRRIHGNTVHTGKLPKRGASRVKLQREIEQLKAQLQLAVSKEQYEKAAELRDRIKNLEKNQELR
ncbi:MAG: UvrB/UvrC motif-containing protein [Bacillota bacterium]